MAIYSGISHWKWWFSIVMLVYQRVVGIHWIWLTLGTLGTWLFKSEAGKPQAPWFWGTHHFDSFPQFIAMNWDIQYPIFRHTNIDVDQHFSINCHRTILGISHEHGHVSHQRWWSRQDMTGCSYGYVWTWTPIFPPEDHRFAHSNGDFWTIWSRLHLQADGSSALIGEAFDGCKCGCPSVDCQL